MNLFKKCVPTSRRLQQIKIACALAACSLLFGCSTLISHSQSGSEPDIHAKRSLGTTLDDNAIVGKIEAKLRKLNEQFAAMVQVDSYNKIVLLTGRVPDKGFIDQSGAIAARQPGVRQVHLEITHGEPTTISNYWYDAWLTTKVKSQLTLTSNAPASKTKVRSFAGYIYLMGVMTPQEAKNAIYVASRVPGAKKVVSMIETIDPNGKAIVAHPPERKNTTAPENNLEDENSNFIAPIELESNQFQSSQYDNSQFGAIPSGTGLDISRPLESSQPASGQSNGFYNEYQQPSSVSPQQVEGL